jgi:hypothetical protein
MTKAFMQAISSAFVHAPPFTMLRWESSIAANHRGEGATKGTASPPALNFRVPENYDFIYCLS